jgi:hypothetical protein
MRIVRLKRPKVVKFKPSDAERVNRLFEEIQARLLEVASIEARTLKMDVPPGPFDLRNEKSLLKKGKLPGQIAFAKGKPRPRIVCTPFGCICCDSVGCWDCTPPGGPR